MKKIPVCSILGVHIAAIDMKTTLDHIQQNIRELKGKYICVSNVHTTVMSYENDEYRNIQNSGALALPDGKPLSVVCRKRGFSGADRVTGPALFLWQYARNLKASKRKSRGKISSCYRRSGVSAVSEIDRRRRQEGGRTDQCSPGRFCLGRIGSAQAGKVDV